MKRGPWFCFLVLFPLLAGAQDRDHPATTLARLQEAFRAETKREAYPRMIALMDSMMIMEQAIDRNAVKTLFHTYGDYGALFYKSAEGRTVHHLFMYTRFPLFRDSCGKALPATPQELSVVLASPYQELLLNSPVVYPCDNLYELALFVLEDYGTLTGMLEAGRGNVPHNLIAARFLWITSLRQSPEKRMAALDALISDFPDTEPVSHAYLEKAQLLTETKQYEKALQVSRDASRKFRKSPVRSALTDMVEFLTEPSLHVTVKRQVYPNASAQAIVTRRNLARYRLLVRDARGKKMLDKTYGNLQSPVYQAVFDTLTLPAPGPGVYTLTVKKGGSLTRVPFYSGKMAAMFLTQQDTGYVYATDLKTGEPLEKVQVCLSGQRRAPYIMDLDGFTPLDIRTGETFRLCIPATQDAAVDSFSLPLTVHPWDFSHEDPAKESTSATLFTDRKLYRTDDTLFFKGIVTRFANGTCEPVRGTHYTVVLRNNNTYRDTLDYREVSTNEFGSFSGYFLPGTARMNGTHSITIPGASAAIRIEAYARPTFSVALSPVLQAYAFKDTVVQEGAVLNYAGFPLKNIAVVSEVIMRPAARPFYTGYGMYPDPGTRIRKDTVYTDSLGRFRVEFCAERPGEDGPGNAFVEVRIQAVDMTGETQEKATFLPISPYRYRINATPRNQKGSTHNRILLREASPVLHIEVSNATGALQDVQGTYALSREDKVVFTGTFTGVETEQPPWTTLPSGKWEVVPDLEGAPASSLDFILVGENDTLSPSDTTAFFCPLETPGPSFLLGTVDKPLFALAEWYSSGTLLAREHLSLQPGMQLISFKSGTEGVFPLELRLVAVRDGVFHEFRHTWEKAENNDLDLQFSWFRNVTGPNSRETFSLTITPPVKAEVLVSVFNESTDRLSPNSFHYLPARAPYVPVPYIRHYFMQDATPRMRTAPVQGLYYAAGREASAQSDLKISEDNAAEGIPPLPGDSGNMTPPRSDFRETLAFLPHLVTDSTGSAPVSFYTNGLLGTFRILALAHTRDGRSATASERLIVKKEVMAMPSFPSFLREKDRIGLTAAVVNLTAAPMEGEAFLVIGDDTPQYKPAGLLPGERALFRWNYTAPEAEAGTVPLSRITAGFSSTRHSDAEQHTLPVLSLQEPVTRAQTRILRTDGVVTLVRKDRKSLAHLEVSTPITSALNALPALCEPAGTGLTQWVASFYANNTGAWLLEKFPDMLTAVEQTPEGQAAGMILGNPAVEILLDETPWANYPGQEAERIGRLHRLTDPEYLRSFNNKAVAHFSALQHADGGFSWFPGMESSYVLTLHFLEKIGDLQENGIFSSGDPTLLPLVRKAIRFTDSVFTEQIRDKDLGEFSPDENTYLYVRSAFPHIPFGRQIRKIAEDLAKRPEDAWKGASVMEKAYLAITLLRLGETASLGPLLASLREFAVCEQDSGCHFPNAVTDQGLMQSEIKAHALLLRVFTQEPRLREGITRWILDRKENNIWRSHEGTTDVIHALLHYGGSSLTGMPQYKTVQRGTTYTVRNRSGSLLYVTLYEKTVEDLTHAQPYANGLEVSRTFHRPGAGPALCEGDTLHPGEMIIARYHLKNDKTRSFVSMKASRASCLLPRSEVSGFQWNSTTSWFGEVKLSTTHYYFQNLPAGGHTIEETFYVTQTGVFSQGSIQAESLYAPRYRGFSPGGKWVVGE